MGIKEDMEVLARAPPKGQKKAFKFENVGDVLSGIITDIKQGKNQQEQKYTLLLFDNVELMLKGLQQNRKDVSFFLPSIVKDEIFDVGDKLIIKYEGKVRSKKSMFSYNTYKWVFIPKNQKEL